MPFNTKNLFNSMPCELRFSLYTQNKKQSYVKTPFPKPANLWEGELFFPLKMDFKVAETSSKVRSKVYSISDVLRGMTCLRNCNFTSNFILKLKKLHFWFFFENFGIFCFQLFDYTMTNFCSNFDVCDLISKLLTCSNQIWKNKLKNNRL
jgi:hypothetical protein